MRHDLTFDTTIRMRWGTGSLTEGEMNAADVVAQEIKETVEAALAWVLARDLRAPTISEDKLALKLVESHVRERLDALLRLARKERPGGDMARVIDLASRATKELQVLRDPTRMGLLVGMDVQLTPY